MAKNKTTESDNSVTEYLNNLPDDKQSKDCSELIHFIHQQTGLAPKMWGTGIVGFGKYHYKYASGHEGDAPFIGIAARANAITLYLTSNFADREELLKKFGKHKTGKGCIYIKKMEDIDMKTLGVMIANSIEYRKNQSQL